MAEDVELEHAQLEMALHCRPRTRGDCRDGPRPCPWVSCRHHLALDVSPRRGTLKINRGAEAGTETCSLDVAERGGLTMAQAAELMGFTEEGLRRLEGRALEKARRRLERTAEDLRKNEKATKGKLGRGEFSG